MSDLDVFVVVEELPSNDAGETAGVYLEPASVPIGSTRVDGRKWDVIYWSTSQVEQVLSKVDPAVWAAQGLLGTRMTMEETAFLDRVDYGSSISGSAWQQSRAQIVRRSALRQYMASLALSDMARHFEDAVGCQEQEDHITAAFAARQAYAEVVSALLFMRVESGLSMVRKWQARMVSEVEMSELDFASYLAVMTMQGFAPSAPDEWITSTLMKTQELETAIDVGHPVRADASLPQ